MKLKLRFHPQAWQNDYAVPVDPEGPTDWEMDWEGELPDDDSNDSDNFRNTDTAPRWVWGWSGPFWVQILNRDELEED